MAPVPVLGEVIHSLSTKLDLSGIFGVPGHKNLVKMRFYASGVRAIDFSHQITPNRVIFTKQIFLPNHLGQMVTKCISFKARFDCMYLRNQKKL